MIPAGACFFSVGNCSADAMPNSPMKPPLRFLLSLAALGAVLAMSAVPCAVSAESRFTYAIDLAAPAAQRDLLETHLDLYRWREHERMDQSELQRLVLQAPEQVRKLLSTEGFYAPQIDTGLEQRDGEWRVTLKVEPGEPVRVGDFELRISGPLADQSANMPARLEQIRKDWPLRPGAVFRHRDWEAAKRGALKSLMLNGYPAASIAASRAEVDPLAKQVGLHLTLDSGPGFTFGPLAIRGLRRYPPSIIERLNPIVPDTPYAQDKLLELQSKLQDSSYFASVTVRVDTETENPLRVPVEVEVKENPARKLGFGIGFSTDSGPRGQIDYRDLDIFDRAWIFSSAVKLDDKRRSLGSELQFPLSAEGYRDRLNTVVERSDIEGEITHKLVVGALRSRLAGVDEYSYGVRYFLEQQEIAGAREDGRGALVPSIGWSHRKVDNLLYPSRGYLFNLQSDGASEKLLSDRDFLRLYGRGLWFYPFATRQQLILRGELGRVLSSGRDGIPSDFLFRTGGDQTVRGYAYQSLGVREGDATVGGRALVVASAEVIRWLSAGWGIAVFADAGDAADRVDELAPVLGYGVGARWRSPIGPLNLDLAYGRETARLRLHFSVGFSF